MRLANDFIYSSGIHHYSGDNAAQQYAMKTSLYDRLALLSQQQQWILVTSESHRPDLRSLVSHKIPGHKVVQLRSSRTMDEYHVIRKAILSGNASAIVASQRLTEQEQTLLTQLGRQNHCEVFFIADPSRDYH
ncbi:SulA-like leucine-rich domain-containing protein [Vibrio mangrovi]|uniref:SOS cell division inhibitor n=1 Tax=Vibrio mangrovi TaxID=474394 RepID=A0A1Y6IP09_9VIBR|nr:SulA-like leucine-rich domain-containing protein [Vibrio mangrovi]MDW6003806.1 SulA-like leucine-rich domain-containing protein [Vibrio mangrovi]SMR99399.1 SOS cell division inhibitor [Vibrio mangrovi]